jgi:cyclopropane-fatty-acyl-phospholipid synthase
MTLIKRFADGMLPVGQVTLIMPDGRRDTFGGGGGDHRTVRIHDKPALIAVLKNPRLGIGEMYMDGRLTIEDGTILDLLQLVVGANPFEAGGHKGKLKKKRLGRIARFLRRNPADRSKRNVAHHYDLDGRLYRLFLDPDLQYSCAYFRDSANSLEQAQADKKAHIAAKLYLQSGQRVLDIGCGWGGMALYLHRVADVDVLGVTLSEEQLAVARQRAEQAGVADRVRFELTDYRAVSGHFDRIVSVGMFEHVGAAHHREFFAKCRELLSEDGVMLLHTIGKYGTAGAPDPFTDKYIFPGYHVPSLSQIVSASERVRLIASDVETLRLHYAYTLRHWMERAVKARDEIVAMYDERFFRMWEFYLAGGIVAFENGAMNNYQVQYIRDRRALPITRDYMVEAEERHRRATVTAARKPRARSRAKTLETT